VLEAAGWGYLLLFVGVVALDAREGRRRGLPLAWTLIDLALGAVAAVGVALWLAGSAGESLRAAWRFVSPVLVAGFVAASVLEISWIEREALPELSAEERRSAVLVGSALGIAVTVPALVINLSLAFGF
jgi:hypothetical protein